MWIKSKSGELVNLDCVTHIAIREDGVLGGQKTQCVHAVVTSGGNATMVRLSQPGPSPAPHEKVMAIIEKAISGGDEFLDISATLEAITTPNTK